MSRVVPIDTPWPVWTNPEIVLYHGTTQTGAEAIIQSGVDVSKGSDKTDFGRGFYTTTGEHHAKEWAERRAER